MKQVGAEQRALRLFIQQPRIPAVRQLRGRAEAVLMSARVEQFAVDHPFGRPDSEVIDIDHRRDQAADRLCVGSHFQPLVERPAFIRLKMTEGDIPQVRRIHHLRDRFVYQRKAGLIPGRKQQRRVITDQKIIKLQIQPLSITANPKHIRCNFVHGGSVEIENEY